MPDRTRALVAALLALQVGCHIAQPEGPPDIVLVLVDGLRADPPGEVHAEAALLKEARLDHPARFRKAYAQSPSAFLGLHALLTGRYPSAVPICTPSRAPARDTVSCAQVPADRAMLQEMLAAYGYHTAFFEEEVSSRPDTAIGLSLEPEVGPLRGFEVQGKIGAEAWGAGEAPALEAWWRDHADAPRFVLVHGYLSSDTYLAACRLDRPLSGRPGEALFPAATRSPEGRAAIEAGYLDAARAAGRLVGALHEALEAGPGGRIFVLGSLFGANLTHTTGVQSVQLWCGTHGHLLERNLHVPLLVEGAGSSPREDEVVQLIDLLPTAARAAGAAPPAGAQGRDLFGPAQEGATAYAEYGDMLALRQGDELLSLRCFRHGGSSLDPVLTEEIIQDQRHLRSTPERAPLQPRCPTTLHDVERDYFQAEDLAQTERAILLERYQRLVEIRSGPGAPAAIQGADGTPTQRRLTYW
ncbi:MAG: hypothetical protein ABIO70_23230 [Pseudomonadota bacterium]